MRCFICVFALLASQSAARAQKVPDSLLPPAVSAPSADLPAPPPGRSTVMGGKIEMVDLVRDQLTLTVAGGHSIKILFDERTQVYSDGKKISVLDLHPEDHASIETNLDGTAIFALRIHMLSNLPDGEIRAKVLNYDRATGRLKVLIAASNEPLTLVAAEGTPIMRVGQKQFTEQKGGFADLVQGTLIDVTFKGGKTPPAAATRVEVLAVPGANFVFRGRLTFLDFPSGRMSIENGSDRPADISFEPARFDVSHELHQGSVVKVTAYFDGNRYIASAISLE